MGKRFVQGACAILTLGLGLGLSVALAQDQLAVIKQRQQLMKQQSEGLKAIQGYVSGQETQAMAVAKANELLTLSPQIVGLFPTGTSLAEFPGQTHHLPVRLELPDVLLIVLASLVVAFAATVDPSLQAARLEPVDAIRHE